MATGIKVVLALVVSLTTVAGQYHSLGSHSSGLNGLGSILNQGSLLDSLVNPTSRLRTTISRGINAISTHLEPHLSRHHGDPHVHSHVDNHGSQAHVHSHVDNHGSQGSGFPVTHCSDCPGSTSCRSISGRSFCMPRLSGGRFRNAHAHDVHSQLPLAHSLRDSRLGGRGLRLERERDREGGRRRGGRGGRRGERGDREERRRGRGGRGDRGEREGRRGGLSRLLTGGLDMLRGIFSRNGGGGRGGRGGLAGLLSGLRLNDRSSVRGQRNLGFPRDSGILLPRNGRLSSSGHSHDHGHQHGVHMHGDHLGLHGL